MIKMDVKQLPWKAKHVVILAIVIPTIYTLYTQHAWEDWYITFRASKNLALGNGLVFTPGQRIHSFTSPLGTLVPALLSFLTLNRVDGLVLWLFRALSILLLAGSALNLHRLSQRLGLAVPAAVLILGLFLLDGKSIDFSTNGMETAFVLFFLSLAVNIQLVPMRRAWLWRGIAWAGMMWSRPDGIVYILALAIGAIAFHFRLLRRGAETSPESDPNSLFSYFQSAAVAAVLYAPWLIWAASYYGTFVPHTVIAKGLDVDGKPLDLLGILSFPISGLSGGKSLAATFMPPYAIAGGWPILGFRISTALAWISAFAWLLPRLPREIRSLSLTTLIIQLYLSYKIPVLFPWYIPSATLLTILVLGLLLQHLITTLKPRGPLRRLMAALVACLLTLSLVLTLVTAQQMHAQQRIIENGLRTRIGMWLKQNAATPHDTVFLECLGYIGYFSNLKMYDWPGLSSPEVVATRKGLKTDQWGPVIDKLRPDWLVLRPREVQRIVAAKPDLLSREYEIAKVFDVSDAVAAAPISAGRPYLEHDQKFTVYKRKARLAVMEVSEQSRRRLSMIEPGGRTQAGFPAPASTPTHRLGSGVEKEIN